MTLLTLLTQNHNTADHGSLEILEILVTPWAGPGQFLSQALKLGLA